MNAEAAGAATGVVMLVALWCASVYVWPFYTILSTAAIVLWVWTYARFEDV